MFWFYFVRPIERLAEHWQFKLPIALIAATFWSVIKSVLGVYSNLLSMPPYLLGMASLAFIGDFASAVLSAYREDGIEGFELIKFRQLLIKASYWIVVIFTFSNLATGAERAGVPILNAVDVGAVMWLTVQDVWSTVKNWKGKEGAREWFQGAINLANGDFSLDQLDNKNDS